MFIRGSPYVYCFVRGRHIRSVGGQTTFCTGAGHHHFPSHDRGSDGHASTNRPGSSGAYSADDLFIFRRTLGRDRL